ncbi:TPA: flagella biosynthesis regulatory protein FliT [Pluralibacter gergoviae]|uniref:Flagellar protein FliT n=1 Tax=Pluralibacter gergoviae TaxID=61647 RepID=A0A0J5Q3N9_PLUGE|nr:flagella biosynthesis regulatory protein FliT [Pluralibacter gergoviae]KMK15974.1 flagellar biosynthesis protein FliT [Pluralibacter gergoviae]KMK17299.1 flagellar biosynthesis protein FliT [Pluralibacter gergoviae]KMK27207.1 flagellar biosynthesis protein FliT [Pluralibacter gergoviae]MBL3695207.1 flagella biosynthesis regulatory protein FliT [Pluralibacter gergoviae]HDS1154011.1 flagella biosynthesis regulatory protein FliT [Pluralibacter gergoviae]
MSNAPSLYSLYQQLLTRGQTMLALAASAQWEALIASEMDYVRAVQQVAQLTETSPPSAAVQQQIRPLLGAILDVEQQIKTRLQARMDELATLVNQSTRQKSVLTAYGNQGGKVLVPQASRDPG